MLLVVLRGLKVMSSIEAGFAAHMTKPVTLDQLGDRIARVLERPAVG